MNGSAAKVKDPQDGGGEVPECVPCQVAIWNRIMGGMVAAAGELAATKLANPNTPYWPGDDWGRRFYRAQEAACALVQPLLEEAGHGSNTYSEIPAAKS